MTGPVFAERRPASEAARSPAPARPPLRTPAPSGFAAPAPARLSSRAPALPRLRGRASLPADLRSQRPSVVAVDPAEARASRVPAQPAGAGPGLMDALQRSAGMPLALRVRADAEAALGADLSSVRVHTGGQADRAAAALHAQACTIGSHIAFRRGRFDPESRAGRRLLLHETAHVLQQRQGLTPAPHHRDGQVPVSEPGDRLERQADARADAPRALAPPGPPQPSGPAAAPALGHAIQRSVGLELEHSVPIYRDIWGLVQGEEVTTELDEEHTARMYPEIQHDSIAVKVTKNTGGNTPPKEILSEVVRRKDGPEQEQSLRIGSYAYDNDAPVYRDGGVVVKTDNSQYSKALKYYLERHNPRKLPTVIPAKGISIAEYTTAAPGLDELAPGAADAFRKHVAAVENQIKLNERQGQHVPGRYYVGEPKTIEPKLTSFGALGFQVTVGVLPSQIDALHRLAVKAGQVSGNPRTVQETINSLMDNDLSGVIGAISAKLEKWASVGGDLWSPLRRPFLSDATLPYSFAEWEAALAPRAAVVQKAVSDTVRSIFRVALSYYLGARLKVNTGEIEKNALALLSRADLTSVFTKAGLAPVLVDFTSPAGLARAQSRFADRFIKQLSRYENDITRAVDDAVKKESYQRHADPEVLSGIPAVELMRLLVKDEEKKGISHISPGIRLTKPDPLSMSKQVEPVRPELGGSQFEYRTLSVGNWQGKFLEIGMQMFDLNTQHLYPEARKTLRERAGW